jgi:hypothetical protein
MAVPPAPTGRAARDRPLDVEVVDETAPTYRQNPASLQASRFIRLRMADACERGDFETADRLAADLDTLINQGARR